MKELQMLLLRLFEKRQKETKNDSFEFFLNKKRQSLDLCLFSVIKILRNTRGTTLSRATSFRSHFPTS